MNGLHPYAARVLQDVKARLPWESEFYQAVGEVFASITPILQENLQLEHERILERLVEPERIISFRVVSTDDRGRIEVHRGYRVQFNNALGPFKGGLRFHASVSLGSLKFLGFEQTFKNALTGLPLGGGKGGSDFQPRGRSDAEVMRFCHAYMEELFRHIGPDVDVPAGDIGVGGREIGYLFGKYKKLTGRFDGSLTGKGLGWGGSRLRPEATGFGVAYMTQEVLARVNNGLEGKRVAISGFGQVAWGAAQKVTELGGKVISISGPDGFVHEPNGLSPERISFMQTMRRGGRDEAKEYAEKFGVEFHENKRPWVLPCDVAIPCAIQNELDENDAKTLVANGCRFVIEGANMPSTSEAQDVFHDAGIVFVPGKAANAGGVAVSALEMSQNRTGQTWPAERVDGSLRTIMHDIHELCVGAAQRYGDANDYVLGANAAGFLRVTEAMIDQGAV